MRLRSPQVGQYSDAVAVLSRHHLPGHALLRAMAAAAAALGGADKHRVAVWPTMRELCTAADVVRDLLQRGWSLPAATTSAWRQTYVLAASAHGIDPETALAAYYSHIAPAVAFAGQEQQPLVQPLSWPVPFTVADLVWGSPVSVQRRSGAVLCVAAAQAFAAEVAGQWNGTAAAAVRNSTAASLLPIALWRQSEAVRVVLLSALISSITLAATFNLSPSVKNVRNSSRVVRFNLFFSTVYICSGVVKVEFCTNI